MATSRKKIMCWYTLMFSARSVRINPMFVASVMDPFHAVKVKCSLLSNSQYVACNIVSSTARFI